MTKRLEPSYDSGILTNGALVAELEERAAAYLGVPHVVAVSSCTSGLILTLQALVEERPGEPFGARTQNSDLDGVRVPMWTILQW